MGKARNGMVWYVSISKSFDDDEGGDGDAE